MLTDNQIRALRAPFPTEALTPDTSRGFELTSIKAAYVIERLNDVFGPCGSGWRYAHAPFETLVLADQRTEILTEIALQYRVADSEQRGCPPVEWRDGWRPDHDRERVWSEPIYATGGRSLGRGNAPYTDARKSAVTDGLTKAASMIGVGHEVFKGLIRLSGGNGSTHRSPQKPSERSTPDNPLEPSAPRSPQTSPERTAPVNATAFWSLYNRRAKELGIAQDVARELTRGGDWSAAYHQLETLIQQTPQ